MIDIGDELHLGAGVKLTTFRAGDHVTPAGLLITPTDFKVEDVNLETVKLKASGVGTVHVRRQDALRALGLLGPGLFVDRTPAPGDTVLHLQTDERAVVRTVKDGKAWTYAAGSPDIVKLPLDELIVVPANPFGYAKAGFPTFETLVGLSDQGVLRRPKTMLMDTEKKVRFVLDHLRALTSEFDFPAVGYDTETTGLTGRAYIDGRDFILGLCVAWDANSGFYLPLTEDLRPLHEELLTLLKEKASVIMHNATFDIIATKQAYGIDLREGVFHDTQVQSKLIDENRLNHKLKPLATDLLGRTDVIEFSTVSVDHTLVGVDPLIAAEYAGADAANTLGLHQLLYPQLEADPGLLHYYDAVEIPAIARIAVPIADNGLNVDRAQLETLHARIEADHVTHMQSIQVAAKGFIDAKLSADRAEVRAAQQEAYARMESLYGDCSDVDQLAEAQQLIFATTNLAAAQGLARARAFKKIDSFLNLARKAAEKPADTYEFNPNSPLQMKEILHDHWKLPVVKITKTGEDKKQEQKGPWTKADERKYSSVGTKSIPALQLAHAQQKNPDPDAAAFFDAFKAYSKVDKLLSAFTRPTLDNLDTSGTTVIHPSFNSLGTKSGRSSCTNPNLQQLPSDDTLYDLRDCFVPDTPEHVFIDADYNAQEIRVMAAFSRDPDLLRIIEEDRDLHCHTVRTVWPETGPMSDDEIKDGEKKKRQKAKVTFFLTGYGGGKFKLAESLLIPVDEAGHIISTLKFKAFPRLTEWKEEQTQLLRDTKELTLPCGYKRRLRGFERAKDPQRAKSGMERSIVNTVIQGTSAEMMKSAWFRVEDALQAEGIAYQIKILIHDQMVFQVLRTDAVRAAHLCNEHMRAELFGVPVPGEVEIKTSLSKSKDANDQALEADFHGKDLSYDEVAEILDFEPEVYIE
ncbi:DNA polymerase [Deinococcus kurensis]|uniref:DNA polymerase n=1 Tax=Deinococcus kurensis TaxID=2662757 RepID=UPI0012D30593|nr:DNA polymerase [Deinococcus kurensis]